MFDGRAHGEEVFVATGEGVRGGGEGREETNGFPSYLGGMRRCWRKGKKTYHTLATATKGLSRSASWWTRSVA